MVAVLIERRKADMTLKDHTFNTNPTDDMTASIPIPPPCQGCINGTCCGYHPPGHPPPMHYSYGHNAGHHPVPSPYYTQSPDNSMSQFIHIPTSGFGPPPPPLGEYYPPPPQPVYYGSWPGPSYSGSYSSPPIHPQVRQHYSSYHPRPTNRQSNGKHHKGVPSSIKTHHSINQYAVPNPDVTPEEFTFSGIPHVDIQRAISFVKRNSSATLFDINGTSRTAPAGRYIVSTILFSGQLFLLQIFFMLPQTTGLILEVATADEGTRRFVQKRIKLGTDEEKQLGLTAALSSLEELWSDPHGNFMLQAIFENGTETMKKELMAAIYEEDVMNLSLHMHGCRVIQRAMRTLDRDDLTKLISEFHEKVITLIHDPNGNHVIQGCIRVISDFAISAEKDGDPELAKSLADELQFIIYDVISNVDTLSKHRYGCRVVQRVIEYCVEKQKEAVLEVIISCVQNEKSIVEDQYGNYVIQQTIVCGKEEHQAAILEALIADGAFHVYASTSMQVTWWKECSSVDRW
eukprot:g9249.t1.1.5e17418a g9249  g9249.t1 contig36:204652-206381(+)